MLSWKSKLILVGTLAKFAVKRSVNYTGHALRRKGRGFKKRVRRVARRVTCRGY